MASDGGVVAMRRGIGWSAARPGMGMSVLRSAPSCGDMRGSERLCERKKVLSDRCTSRKGSQQASKPDETGVRNAAIALRSAVPVPF